MLFRTEAFARWRYMGRFARRDAADIRVGSPRKN
jgi:hypothetical protein